MKMAPTPNEFDAKRFLLFFRFKAVYHQHTHKSIQLIKPYTICSYLHDCRYTSKGYVPTYMTADTPVKGMFLPT